MIEKLQREADGDIDWEYGNRAMGNKINEIIQAVNRLKENECGCSNCTEWRLINAQSALKGMNK